VAELQRIAFEAGLEIERISSTPVGIAQRARELLAPLRRVIPFEAARIALMDPAVRQPVTLVSEGYDGAVRSYFESPAVLDEIELIGLYKSRSAFRLRDLPVPASEIQGWVEHLEPAGFRDGLAVGLFSGDGRFVGFLGLNTDTTAHPTAEARDVIGALAPMIANAIDPMRSITAAAQIVHDARAGVVLTQSGATLPLPGLADHPVLRRGSAVLDVAADWVGSGRVHGTFLCPYGEAGYPDDHLRVTVLACPSTAPQYLSAIVVLSPPKNMRTLTHREVQLLGLLVEGWPNRRIAASLIIAQRTVAAHVEHILAKLGAPSRTAAVVLAMQQGLFIPHALIRLWE
jgi:DNA-binding CsgD family transcriptional regulator